MLVGKSTAEYVLVKGIIYAFSYLGLICLIYFYLALSIGGVRWISHPFSIAVEVLGAIEILFYLFWFLPYRYYLHKQRPWFPPPPTPEARKEIFYKSLSVTDDIELCLKKWMGGSSLEDLRRENLKEWLLWALFDRDGPPGADDAELEGYVEAVEEALGREIQPGLGPVESVRLNFQPFIITHRALTFYLIIGCIDFTASITLLVAGFSFYRQPRLKFFKSFPLRPLTLIASNQSASPRMSYFYRPHTSKKNRPIVFIHCVGIGLALYIPFFLMLPKDIGILAIEFLPVSSRICEGAPLAEDIAREIGDIITQQNLTDFVFVGNSYGTFFTKLFLSSSHLASRMAKIVLIDPVAILLHFPDAATNFTRRKPRFANELELYWAAQTEPDIAFTFAKRMCWREHVLWREDLLKKPTTVIMGGSDCLVKPEAIAAGAKAGALKWDWEDREKWKRSLNDWTGEGLELVWLEGYDHGQGILGQKMLPRIVRIVERYCEKKVVHGNAVMK
ncbi:hypothetical protein CC80DRAFT_529937 [Byssothecium circinans]|uniref:AB hydrolase-1 domain-containing protein n=1 Tax=Byssothecium circinans TaxID=147558 RepID=A0A6A5TA00_9PLEO|nr:hypothetical protein CC80DRAFT_529937 [Byssothecium circinans]